MYTWEKAITKAVNETHSAVVSGLRPFTFYMVSVQAVNAVGESERSTPSDVHQTWEAGQLSSCLSVKIPILQKRYPGGKYRDAFLNL